MRDIVRHCRLTRKYLKFDKRHDAESIRNNTVLLEKHLTDTIGTLMRIAL